MGIVPNRKSAADYDSDMKLAKSVGIDAFALNIGVDDYTSTQVGYAYESAANNDMKVFISFDFNWFKTGDAATVGDMIKTYGSKAAQLKVDNKIFVSSFAGDGLDIAAVRSAVGSEIYIAPNFHPENTTDPSAVDGALNWMGWDSNGANRAPSGGVNVTVSQGDDTYTKWLGQKGYIAPVSPWFSTHYGPEVSYSKNWVFPGNLLWYERWNEILNLSPQFVEIITWNDYGESHYVGPLSSKHTDDGNSKWANDMPHDGWLEMAKPFIAAYKAGSKKPSITEDKLVYWYRPTPKGLDCKSTDTYGSAPDGGDTMEDAVFVVALLKEAGQVTVNSGSNSKTFDAPAGASAYTVDIGVGVQKFGLVRGGQQVLSATSLRNIVDTCPCGIYNFNAFVGTVPAGPKDELDSDGLAGLTKGKLPLPIYLQPLITNKLPGLKVSCEPKPSLPIGSGAGVDSPAPVATSGAGYNATSAVLSSAPASSAPVTSAVAPTSAVTPTSVVIDSPTVAPTSIPEIKTAAASSAVAPTTTAAGSYGGCTTITASSQIAPTNCLSSGQVWGGSYGSPDYCDGAKRC